MTDPAFELVHRTVRAAWLIVGCVCVASYIVAAIYGVYLLIEWMCQ
jgi:hypothetical protein